MSAKLDDSFLTCMQACDTIALVGEMGVDGIVSHYDELMWAITVVLQTEITDLPDYMWESISELQGTLVDMLGVEVYENLNSSARSEVLYV